MFEVIEKIQDADFVQPSQALDGSTPGQHFRHSIEFFECLASGYERGVINYDSRDHDRNLESSRVLAMEMIHRIKDFVSSASFDKKLILEVSYDPHTNDSIKVESNMAREVIYNIEHVVHHMALVKIGMAEICPGVKLPEGFGVAVSTIKFHGSQV